MAFWLGPCYVSTLLGVERRRDQAKTRKRGRTLQEESRFGQDRRGHARRDMGVQEEAAEWVGGGAWLKTREDGHGALIKGRRGLRGG